MGTFSKAYIKNDSIEVVKNSIGKYYRIINEEVDTYYQDWRFFGNGSDTIILTKSFNYDWVEVTLNYHFALYFHDELLRRQSKELECDILYGYYQSTSGLGRLSAFKNGELTLSIIQCEVSYKGESFMRLMDNWGVSDDLRREFKIPSLMDKYFEINVDAIYKFYKLKGLEWDGIIRNETLYHHLEIRNG